MLLLPNNLVDFVNNGTTEEATSVGGNAYCFHGDLYYSRDAYFCECCSCRKEIHNTYHVQLRHVCIGDHVTFVLLDKHQFICPKCRQTEMQQIPFQAEHHRITVELLAYTENASCRPYVRNPKSHKLLH